MNVFSRDFSDMGPLPLDCAFGTFERFEGHARDKFKVRENRNPDLRWINLPVGTRSLAIICDDLDAADVTQAQWASGKVPKDIVKRALCHWVVVDFPPEIGGIAKGEFSDGVLLGGKPGPASRYGARQGINAMGAFFKDDLLMQGDYFGYDGPCPPYGAKPHRYEFTVYALDVERLEGLPSLFTKEDVLHAIKGKILGNASVTGCF